MDVDTNITIEIDDDMIADAIKEAVENHVDNVIDVEEIAAEQIRDELRHIDLVDSLLGDSDTMKALISDLVAALAPVYVPVPAITDPFRNPLTPSGLCSTPESMEKLEAYVALFSEGERVVATTVMGMTWNLACATVDLRLKELRDAE